MKHKRKQEKKKGNNSCLLFLLKFQGKVHYVKRCTISQASDNFQFLARVPNNTDTDSTSYKERYYKLKNK